MCRTRSFAYSSAHTQHSGEGLGFGGGGGGAVRPRGGMRNPADVPPPATLGAPAAAAMPTGASAARRRTCDAANAPSSRADASRRVFASFLADLVSSSATFRSGFDPSEIVGERSASPLRVTRASLRGRLRHLRAFRAFRRRPRAFGPHAPFHLRLAFQILEERRRRRSSGAFPSRDLRARFASRRARARPKVHPRAQRRVPPTQTRRSARRHAHARDGRRRMKSPRASIGERR